MTHKKSKVTTCLCFQLQCFTFLYKSMESSFQLL